MIDWLSEGIGEDKETSQILMAIAPLCEEELT